MTDATDDLRATSDDIAADAARLAAIEERKQHLADDDPEVLALSREARHLVDGLVPKAAAELELAEESVGGMGRGRPRPA